LWASQRAYQASTRHRASTALSAVSNSPGVAGELGFNVSGVFSGVRATDRLNARSKRADFSSPPTDACIVAGMRSLSPAGRSGLGDLRMHGLKRHRATRRRANRLLAVVIWTAALLALPSAVRADWSTVNPPADDTKSLVGFAASKGTWLALTYDTSGKGLTEGVSAEISRDQGTTWSLVPWPAALNKVNSYDPGPRAFGIAVGPDGAFYLSAGKPVAGATYKVLRLAPDGDSFGVFLDTSIPTTNQHNEAMSPPAWDAGGALWVGFTTPDYKINLARLSVSGTPDLTYQTAVTTVRPFVEVKFFGFGTFVRAGPDAYQVASDTLVPFGQGMPVFQAGQLVLTAHSESLDGGASFMPRSGGALPVEGDPQHLVYNGWVLQRYSDAFWGAVGPHLRSDYTRLVKTDSGIVAVNDSWSSGGFASRPAALSYMAGDIGPRLAVTGPVSDQFSGWLARAAQLRATAGLPPLIGDPLIEQAAANHSRYWTLNPAPTYANLLDYHSETAGAPGFTGRGPGDRCAAVGSPEICGGEVMLATIDGWAATIYHRNLVIEPEATLVGGAQVPGGPSVMDAASFAGLRTAPIGFPSGQYDGDLSFTGEAPDPTQKCQAAGQPVQWPLGTAVSLYVPGGDVSGFSVAPDGGGPLQGCILIDGRDATFLPGGPLAPYTTYIATAQWTPTEQMGPRTVTWQFHTGADNGTGKPPPPDDGGGGGIGPPPSCTPHWRAPKRVRVGRPIRVSFSACAARRATIALYKLNHKGRRTRRPARRATLAIRSHRAGSLKLSSKRLRAGRYALVASLVPGKTTSFRVVLLAKKR
jgi:hypothetical protein